MIYHAHIRLNTIVSINCVFIFPFYERPHPLEGDRIIADLMSTMFGVNRMSWTLSEITYV
jgi:hypothetical protein